MRLDRFIKEEQVDLHFEPLVEVRDEWDSQIEELPEVPDGELTRNQHLANKEKILHRLVALLEKSGRITNPKKIKGDWKFKARVVPLPGERTRADNASDKAKIVEVKERKLSVLLFASAATRDYQFVRNLLAREADKFEFSICLQSMQNGTVQDIDPKRLLDRFPTELRAHDEDPKNLGNYDVIVAFDPDWKAIQPGELELITEWLFPQAGGLILVWRGLGHARPAG